MAVSHMFLCICVFTIVGFAESAKILLVPFAWKSHVFEITSIGRTLVERGHVVHIILPPSYPDFQTLNTASPFNVIGYEMKEPDFHTLFAAESKQTEDLIKHMQDLSPIEDMRQNVEGILETCRNFLSDEVMFSKLKSLDFDLAIMDAFPCSRCQLAVPYRLGIPYVSLSTTYEPWLIGSPALPSFVPFPYAQYFTERMTFIQRLQNTYQLIDWTYSTRIPYLADDFMRPYIPDKPFRSVNQLAADSKLWLFDTDVIIDYPRPTMPHEINIGGLSTKPASPLADDLQQLMDSAAKGAIIMTFGSFDVLTNPLLQKFFVVFEKLEQIIIIRSEFFTDRFRVPMNVKLLKWLPQNDLLAHPNTRLFITHCGANGQFEALYHGVPMLGFPIFGDQPYNARRAEYHGFGLHMNLQGFTSEALLGNINIILNNQSYYDNIKKASTIFRSQPLTPRERAAYWVERVLNYGMDHLRSHGLDMEWYEYLMLDMFACTFGVIFITLLLSCGVICHCIHLPKSSGHRKSKQQ